MHEMQMEKIMEQGKKMNKLSFNQHNRLDADGGPDVGVNE